MTETVLIVGGHGALGQALTPKLEAQGYHVIIGDMVASGDSCNFYNLDATDPDSIESFVRTIENEGKEISHVVNVVGGLIESGLTDIFNTSVAEIDKTIELNLKSQLYAVRFLGEHLRKASGENKSFTLISSINAHAGYSIPFYSAAKSGLHGFIKPVALELGAHNVRINIVTPGSVKTPSTEDQPKNFKARAEATALKRLCTPDEVADAIIASITLTGITGQEFIVDAGQSINPSESLYDQERQGVVPTDRKTAPQ